MTARVIGGFERLEIDEEGVWAVCRTIHGDTHAFSVTEEEADALVDWAVGRAGPLQYALPHLDADLRELLLSGIPPGEWEDFMGVEDDVDPPEQQLEFNFED